MDLDLSTEPRHPIQVVARRAGLTADVLRAWERRYEAVTPGRSEGGRRLYSDLDVERLRLMRLAIDGGRRIGQVATLDLDELQRLVDEDRVAAKSRPVAKPGREGGAEAHFEEAMHAVQLADAIRLRLGLQRAAISLPPMVFLENVTRPLMHEIGRRWAAGEMSPGYEHLASGAVRQILTQLIEALQPGSDAAPHLVVGTPAGQRHELGALMVTAVAALEGWRTTFLAGDLPAEEIARVAKAADARAVAVSITTAADNIPDELARLRGLLGDEIAMLVGGQAAETYQETIQELRAVRLGDIPSLRAVLQTLSTTAA